MDCGIMEPGAESANQMATKGTYMHTVRSTIWSKKQSLASLWSTDSHSLTLIAARPALLGTWSAEFGTNKGIESPLIVWWFVYLPVVRSLPSKHTPVHSFTSPSVLSGLVFSSPYFQMTTTPHVIASSSGHHSQTATSNGIVGNHFRVGKKIGEGSFGVVFEGECVVQSENHFRFPELPLSS